MNGANPRGRSIWRPVLLNAAIALLLVLFVNLSIQLAVGIPVSGTRGGNMIGPIPGWFIGLVWTGLFLGLGVTRGVMKSAGSALGERAGRAILILILACAVYPLYTFGLRNDVIGLGGNIATIGLAVWVARRVFPVQQWFVVMPLTVVAWLVFASLALLDQNSWVG